MNDNQILIKVILIAVFIAFALLLLLPERGSRRLAIRRIALLFVFIGLIAGVAMPDMVDALAKAVGVGRGTDLLLYAFFVIYVGQSIATARRHRHFERQITELTRRAALDAGKDDLARRDQNP